MRRFRCFLLVLSLMASLFAIPASATVATTATFDGLAAVAAMISGSGVTINAIENFPVFNTLVTSVFDHLTALDIIDAAGTISALVSGQKTYIPSSVVQNVRDFLFTDYILSDGQSSAITSGSFTVGVNTVSYRSATAPVYFKPFRFHYTSYPDRFDYGCVLYSSGTFLYGNVKLTRTHCTYSSYKESVYSLISGYPYLGIFESSSDLIDAISSLYDTDINFYPIEGLTFSDVFPELEKELDENYPAWVEGAILSPPITLPGGTEDDEAIQYLPVSIPSYSVSTPKLPATQTEIWTGIMIEDETGSDTGDNNGQDQPFVPDLNHVLESINNVKDAIAALPGTIVGAIENIGIKLHSIWEWLCETLPEWLQKLLDVLTAIKDWALGLLDALLVGFQTLLIKLFVPDVAVLQAIVADLRAQFPFFDSVIVTGQYLLNGINSGSPPVIYAHLEAAEGAYTWGGTVAVLDMRFYERYKSAGDLIMSSALLTFFAWRTFKRLPSIISGAGADIEVYKEI